MKSLGERIRELREAKDYSLRELAKKLTGSKKEGLTAPFLSDVELGRRFPSDPVLHELARVLGADVEELKALDSRPPVEEMKRLAQENPAYGIAFRKLLEKDVSPDDLINWAKKKPDRKREE